MQRGHGDFVAQEIGRLFWSEAYLLTVQPKSRGHIRLFGKAKAKRNVEEAVWQHLDCDALCLRHPRHPLGLHMQQYYSLVEHSVVTQVQRQGYGYNLLLPG